MEKIVDFQRFSSIRIGQSHKVKIIDDIVSIPEKYYIIGGCNNILLSPTPPPLIMLSKRFDFIKLYKDSLHVGGATPSGKILSFAKKHNLAGFELMQKLPGTLGGMVKMNAGLKKWEIFSNLKKILTSKGWINKKDIQYGYRYTNINDIIYEAVFNVKKGFDNELFQMFKTMRDNQPNYPSCGSCFKNPPQDFAGRLIESVHLKGYRIGGMAMSDKHANFLVNIGKGTFQDAISLISLCKKRVYEEHGIALKKEIVIL